MKKIIFTLFFLVTIISCSKEKFVICNAIKGRVVSLENKKPIKDVRIFVNKFSINSFDSIKTSSNGTFFINGLQMERKYLHEQSNLSYDYHFEKKGYKDKTIIIKNLKESKNNKLDTIDLGNIFLEEEK